MLGPRVQSSGTQVPAVGESPGFTRLPRRWTLTTQLFTREPNRVLWPRATLRLLQGTRQPVLWPGATLRLFTLLKRPTTTTQNHKGAANLGNIFAGESPGPVPQRRTDLGNGAGRSGVGAALVGN